MIVLNLVSGTQSMKKKGLCIYGKMNEKTFIEEDRQIKRTKKIG